MRRKRNLIPRFEKCASLLIDEPSLMRGRWRSEFGRDELHVELGCGKGRFATETAKACPGALIAAFEKSANVILSALELAVSEELQNVRFINAFADDLRKYFERGEVSRIYLNFCDPWPSNRHEKRRLTHRAFFEAYKEVLTDEGEIRFKTDNAALFEFSLREAEESDFEVLDLSRDIHKDGIVGIMTEYEQKFHNQGLPICSARFK